jgi:hypothetical protein
MSVICNITVNVEMKETRADGKAQGQDRFIFRKSYTFANQAGVLGATKCWGDTRTVTGTDPLDISGGVVDQLGQTETFTKGKVLLVHHDDTTGTITVGGGSAPYVGLFSGTITLGADGLVLIVNPTSAGGAVVPTTGDTLQIVASVADTDVDVAFAGE